MHLPGCQSLSSLTWTPVPPGWESLSSLTWKTAPAWMQVSVISRLNVLQHGGKSLLSFSWTTALPRCESLSSLTWITASAWMGSHVKSHPVHSSHLNASPCLYHLDLCFRLDASLCHLFPRPKLLPGWESLSSLTLTILLPGCQSISFLTWTTASSWMGVYVISHLDNSSHLDGTPCHLSPGRLLQLRNKSLSFVNRTSVPA